jgi:outer membrane receptor protein involved in Fe transport
VFSQELQLAGDAVDGRLNWIIGGYYSREFGFDGTQSISLNSFATRSFNEGHVTNKSIAGFGQATFNITDQFGITAGLRYTEEEKRLVSANRRLDGLCNLPVDLRLPGQCLVIRDDTWDALNYSFSLDYKPVDGVLLYAKTSTGFRSGGHNLRGGIDPITFETFDPEHVTDYEIGLKGDWLDGRLRTNLAAYYTLDPQSQFDGGSQRRAGDDLRGRSGSDVHPGRQPDPEGDGRPHRAGVRGVQGRARRGPERSALHLHPRSNLQPLGRLRHADGIRRPAVPGRLGLARAGVL